MLKTPRHHQIITVDFCVLLVVGYSFDDPFINTLYKQTILVVG